MPAFQRPNWRFTRRRLQWHITGGMGRLLPLVLVLLLAACGVTTGSGELGGPASTSTSSSGGTPMSSMPPTNAVELRADHSSYTPSSTIVVTIINHRSTSIFTFDHQTSCTILTLQRQTTSGWETVGGCAMGRATQQVEIKAGETMRISLAPGAGQIRATPWPSGSCRAVLRYTLQRPGGSDATAFIAATPTFSIG